MTERIVVALVLVLLAGAAMAAEGGDGLKAPLRQERAELRARQNTLSPGELRAGERRLDAIEDRAATDPHAAAEALRIYQADRALAEANRALPGGAPSPGLVGPGEQRP